MLLPPCPTCGDRSDLELDDPRDLSVLWCWLCRRFWRLLDGTLSGPFTNPT